MKEFRWICRNVYFREKLYEKFGGLCHLCRKPLGRVEVLGDFICHHTTYDHVCSYPGVFVMQTVRRVRRGVEKESLVKTVNCEKCHSVTPEKFKECLSKLVPLHHKKCHYVTHVILDREKPVQDVGQLKLF